MRLILSAFVSLTLLPVFIYRRMFVKFGSKGGALNESFDAAERDKKLF